jgi:hypothetical protein
VIADGKAGRGDTGMVGWPRLAVTALTVLSTLAFLKEPNATSVVLPLVAVMVGVALVRAGPSAVALIAGAAWPAVAAATLLCWAAFSVHWAPVDPGGVDRILKLATVILAAVILSAAPGRNWARPATTGMVLGFALLALLVIEASLTGWSRDLLTAGQGLWEWFNWEKKPAAVLAVFLLPVLLGAARIAGTRLVVGLGLVFVIAILVSGYTAAILALCAGTASLIGGRYLPRATAISLVTAMSGHGLRGSRRVAVRAAFAATPGRCPRPVRNTAS